MLTLVRLLAGITLSLLLLMPTPAQASTQIPNEDGDVQTAQSTNLLAPAAPAAGPVAGQVGAPAPAIPAAPKVLAPGEAAMQGPAAAGPPSIAPAEPIAPRSAVSQITSKAPAPLGISPLNSVNSLFVTFLSLVACLGAGMLVAYAVAWVTGKKISFRIR